MIGVARLGTNDLERATFFYGELFTLAKVPSLAQSDSVSAWGTPGAPLFIIGKPFNGEPATAGNGTMIGLPLSEQHMVDGFHAKALELGGLDEGQPGFRGEAPNRSYVAYVRDLDGNKLCVFHRDQA